jgi:hypothetical protein
MSLEEALENISNITFGLHQTLIGRNTLPLDRSQAIDYLQENLLALVRSTQEISKYLVDPATQCLDDTITPEQLQNVHRAIAQVRLTRRIFDIEDSPKLMHIFTEELNQEIGEITRQYNRHKEMLKASSGSQGFLGSLPDDKSDVIKPRVVRAIARPDLRPTKLSIPPHSRSGHVRPSDAEHHHRPTKLNFPPHSRHSRS